MYIYIARSTEKTQWFSTQTMPLSMCIIWFFGIVSGFSKDTKIGKVQFESYIQYKEIATKQTKTIINDQYQFYENRELDFDRENQPEIIELLSDEDQMLEIIEISSYKEGQTLENIELLNKEDQIPKIIEISSDEEGQTLEIIELSSNKVFFEKEQITVSRDQTSETAEIKLNL
ncbi:12509_t:CDS:2 [Dentiscutata heterogama]|uniref:12509_t:CDS:1 n=1 Tax=Dentiscutata heterogama TaxID=1316150 RepID=A0ACA9LBA0_9GLOM|nr:12509_t:CDS:2 [Dentiscutata heterogama]